MPVTAKFSKDFYDKFGHEAVDELVDFLNRIDNSSRSELRELNELNFARFDAKLEQRTAELDATIDQQVARLDAKVDQRYAELDAKIDQRVAQAESRLIRWMFAFWAPTALAVVALLLRS